MPFGSKQMVIVFPSFSGMGFWKVRKLNIYDELDFKDSPDL